MNWIKKLVFSRAFDLLEATINENWDEIVAQGKEYALMLLATLKAKLLGVSPDVNDPPVPSFSDSSESGSGDPVVLKFSARLDEVIAQAESEAAEDNAA